MPYSHADVERLIEIEARLQGVDPQLARAVAYHESGFDPTITGDNGASVGPFQLQRKAAIDAGITPEQRYDAGFNVEGGVRYLKQKLEQSGGNVDQALSRYNRGTPEYRGIGDPNYLQRVKRYLKPAAAEAATMSQASSTTTGGSSRLEEIEAELARREGQQAPTLPEAPVTRPRPPTATRAPEQAAASRPQAAQQAPGATRPPAPVSQTLPPTLGLPRPQAARLTGPGDTYESARAYYAQELGPLQGQARLARAGDFESPTLPATHARALGEAFRDEPRGAPTGPLARFLALPSIAQLTPPEREQVTREFQAMPPDQQDEVIRLEVPGDLQQAMARPQASYPRRMGEDLRPDEKRLGAPDEPPLEEGITKPSTMIPLLMPGAGLKLVPGALKPSAPWLNRALRPVAEGLSQTAGWTAGRTAETGEVPSLGEVGKEAAINVATGGVVEIPVTLRAAKNAALRSTPGAQTLLNQRAVQEAERLGKRVFNAEDKAVVTKAFDAVAATGEKLDTAPVRDLWQSLTPAERRIAGQELKKISSTFAETLEKGTLTTWDIGDLQHLRSELRQAGLAKRTPETQDLLQSMRGAVDDAIRNAMAKGSLPAAELVQAQKAYRKVMQAEDLQGLITKHTRDSPNLKWQELNLAALNKELRGGGSRRARELVTGMDATERQMMTQELDSLRRHYPFIRVNRLGTAVTGVGGSVVGSAFGGPIGAVVPLILSAAVSSPTVMSLFKRSIIEGKGRLAGHHVDALLNAIRHENEGGQPSGTGQ